MDPMAEKYYSISPYAYRANNPVNATDPSGELVIFINGMHSGKGGSSDYWNGFDTQVMNHLKDWNKKYIDGAVGGSSSVVSNGMYYSMPHFPSKYRMNKGYERGLEDVAELISSLKKDETIKIITHSMGSAYAKGYVTALLEYFEKNNLSTDLIEFEADFAPFQPTSQEAVKGIETYQFSHNKDRVAGKSKIKGAEYMDTSSDKKQDHGIKTFMDQIKNLPTGKYKVENGQIVPM